MRRRHLRKTRIPAACRYLTVFLAVLLACAQFAVAQELPADVAVETPPAVGAQPAAPHGDLTVPDVEEVGNVNEQDVAVDADPGVEIVTPEESSPVRGESIPVISAPVRDASGGGAGDRVVSSEASIAGSNPVRGSGALPFTGFTQNLLLIYLAFMLLPLGVLFYCSAQRGDRTRQMRSLSVARFQWAGSDGHRMSSLPKRR